MTKSWWSAVRSSGLWRFVRVGTGDAVRSLARLTDRVGPDEAGVAGVIESSATITAVARVLSHLQVAAHTSVIAMAWSAQWTAWREQSPADRTRSTGVAFLAAAGVHLGLSLWRRPVAGWLWLVVPALAAAFGALMVVAPARAQSATKRP